MWIDANSGNPERTRVLVVLSFPVYLPMSSVSIDALSELTENGWFTVRYRSSDLSSMADASRGASIHDGPNWSPLVAVSLYTLRKV